MAEQGPPESGEPDDPEQPGKPERSGDPEQPVEPEQPAQPDADPEDPGEEEIRDPFKREDVKFSVEERVLAVTLLDGPKVSKRSIDVFVLSEFLGQLDRVVRGLAAWARGIPLEPSGRIPSAPDAAPWRSRGVALQHSANLEFVLGEPETTTMTTEGRVSSPTIDAVARLGNLISLDAEPAVDELRDVDDRIGRDFTRLFALLADNQLRSRWAPLDAEPVIVSTERADRVRARLKSESEPTSEVIQITGFLFQLDAKRHDFKIQPEEGDAVTGSYDDSLVDELRSAWRHRVVAEVTRTERRYTYATQPHKVDHELNRILERREPVDE